MGQPVVASYSEAAGTGAPPTGWAFYWNAPEGWAPGAPGDAATGAVIERDAWRSLIWTDDGGGMWTADGDAAPGDPPANYLRAHAAGGHPGDAGAEQDLDRYAIAAYRVDAGGDYRLENASIEAPNAASGGVAVKVFAKGALARALPVSSGVATDFGMTLRGLAVDDEIAVAVGPDGAPGYDTYVLDYDIVRIDAAPPARAHVNDATLGAIDQQTFGAGFGGGSWSAADGIDVVAGDLAASAGLGYAQAQPPPPLAIQGGAAAPTMSRRALASPIATDPTYVSFLARPTSASSCGGVALNNNVGDDPTDVDDAQFVGVIDGVDLVVDTAAGDADDLVIPGVFAPGRTSLVVLRIEYDYHPRSGQDRITVWVDHRGFVAQQLFYNADNQIASLGLASWDGAADGTRQGALLDDVIISDAPPIELAEDAFEPTFPFAVDEPLATAAGVWTYRVAQAGDYQLGAAWIEVVSGTQVSVEVFGGASRRVLALDAPVGDETRFERRLEGLTAGEEITVKATPHNGASYRISFEVARVNPSFDGLPVFEVADYGAVGDGVADDWDAIQGAVDAAVDAGGGVVRFDGAQTYRAVGSPVLSIQNLFDLSDAANIKIDGRGAKLLLQPPDRLTFINACDNVQIDGFEVAYHPLPYYQGIITGIDVAGLTLDFDVPQRYDPPRLGMVGSPHAFFARTFIPAEPGARWGDGAHLYFDEVVSPGGSSRSLRLLARADMANVLQQAQNEGATEIVVPDLDYGHAGNHSVRISSSSRVKVSNVLYRQAPHFWIDPENNVGPVSFSNVDILAPDPNTELCVTWRDGFHVKNNRYGVLIEDGDWHGGAMNDDLFNFSTMMLSVVSSVGDELHAMATAGGHLAWRAGERISVWNPSQTTLRGRARIVSPGVASTYDITLTLDAPIVAQPGDWVVNEDQLNRGQLVRRCENLRLGTRVGSGRLRTSALFRDCHFDASYLWLHTTDEHEGPVPRDIVFEDTYIRGGGGPSHASEPVDVQRGTDIVFRECVIDNGHIHCADDSDRVLLDGVSWINNDGTILRLGEGSDAWLFGGSSRNGGFGDLSDFATITGGAALHEAVPSDVPPSVPPSNGEDAAPPVPPTALVAASCGGGVLLDWRRSDDPGFHAYAVYRATVGGGPYALLATGVTASRYVDCSVSPDVRRFYVVTATDNAGNESGFSFEAAGGVGLCVGDVDGDGDADAADFQLMTGAFGTGPGAADLSNDGQVELRDMAILQTDCGCAQ